MSEEAKIPGNYKQCNTKSDFQLGLLNYSNYNNSKISNGYSNSNLEFNDTNLLFDNNNNNNELDKTDDRLKSTLLYLIGCLCFTLSIMVHKHISDCYSYLGAHSQNLYRCLTVIIMSYFQLIREINNKEIIHKIIFSDYRLSLLLRCSIAFVNILFTILMSSNLRLSTSTTISSLSPLITAFGAIVFLNEKVTKTNIICLVISLIGCVILSNPFNSNNNVEDTLNKKIKNSDSVYGLICAFIFLLSRSFTVLLQKKLSNKIDPKIIILSISLFSFIMSFIIISVFYNGKDVVFLLYTINELFLLILSGVLMFYCQYFIFKAVIMSPVSYLQLFYPSIILFGFVISLVFTNDKHGVSDFVGATIILCVNIYSSYEAYLIGQNKNN